MKSKKSSIILLIGFISCICIADTLHEILPIQSPEKIYLQLDDNIYTTDSTIWFSGTIVNANTHSPKGTSGIVYVELISSDKEILKRKVLKVSNGRINGHFELSENWSTGLYLIRAYTNWNRNFSGAFNFEKYIHLISTKDTALELMKPIDMIEVIDSSGIKITFSAKFKPEIIDADHNTKSIEVKVTQGNSVNSEKIKYEEGIGYEIVQNIEADVKSITFEMVTSNEKHFKKSFSIEEKPITVQFFPESEMLLNGKSGKIAFKATMHGGGLEVEGRIIDDLGNVVSEFKSDPYGIGSFVIRGLDAERKYEARVMIDGSYIEKTFALPPVKLKGTVVNAVHEDGDIALFIGSNEIMDKAVQIDINCRGKRYLSEQVNLNNGKAKVLIPKKSLPEGVIKINVSSENDAQILERFLYNDWQHSRPKINFKNLQANYEKRERVKLDLNLDQKSLEDNNVFLSVLVKKKKNKNALDSKIDHGIDSYLMLSSDFNTALHYPNYYLKEQNRKSLDDLMLTLNSKNYNYSTSSKLTKFKKERQLEISGVVNPVKRNQKKKNVELLFMVLNRSRDVYVKEVTVPGNFELTMMDTYGDNLSLMVQPNGVKEGEKKQYNIAFEKPKIPEIHFDFSEYSYFETDAMISKLETYKDIKKRTDDFNFKYYGSTELDEIVVDAYKMTPERKKVADEHGLPRQVIEEKELKEKTPPWHYGLSSVLEASFQDTMIQTRVDSVGNLNSYIHGVEATLFLVDGILVRPEIYDYIQQIDPAQLTSLEILDAPKNRVGLFLKAFPQAKPPFPSIGIIAMYTKSGQGIFGALKKSESNYEVAQIMPFANPKSFGMPNYGGGDFSESTMVDYRTPLYFNPEIKVQEGRAEIEFFNSDLTGDFEIILEAINGSGKFFHTTLEYRVLEDDGVAKE